MIAAYREPDRARGRELMEQLMRRAADMLAYFDRPGTSNGPTEAIGRLEHLRGSALGFRNLTNYIARSLLETGGFRPRLPHPRCRGSRPWRRANWSVGVSARIR
jgi:Transposase